MFITLLVVRSLDLLADRQSRDGLVDSHVKSADSDEMKTAGGNEIAEQIC